ncbi:hypothetical protein Tco_0360935 [Tanacetum coccineum]
MKWNVGVSLLEYGSEWMRRTTPRSLGKSLLLINYMEGNILLQGRPKKKRKMSKLKDGPLMKDGKLVNKGRTIACGNNKEASGSASRQAQQAKPILGQDGSGASD